MNQATQANENHQGENKQNFIIKALNITLRRENNVLINDFNWEVSLGQHWVILGPNGAGKTLLLRLLTGYLWPTCGTVEILAQRLGTIDVRCLRPRLGWVSKTLEEMTPPEATVREVILSGPSASLGLFAEPSDEKIQEDAQKLAEKFSLNFLLNRPFGLLSSGEKQRTLLARAQLAQPEILFLDEPMSNLDIGGREEFMALLESFAQMPNGPTIIQTTHNGLEIGPFISHALLMKSGAKVADGPVDAVLTPSLLTKTFGLSLNLARTPHGRYLIWG
ncbi:MAG: ABC transporter ATP-binding protein [Candidatus Adiutrix sp.]